MDTTKHIHWEGAMFSKDTLSPTACKGKRFIRRQDLTPDIRLSIAYRALCGAWGVITQLAGDFKICRPFIYTLMKDLKQITETVFGECKAHLKESVKEKVITLILCLRLVGRCSLISISLILKRLGISKYNSVGSVSQILQFAGDSLPNTLENEDGGVKLVIVASDEVFSHLRPILITVDPVSSAILRIELADSRKIEVWKEHWECIAESGYTVIYLVNDEGICMAGAQKEVLVDVIRQPDTFHGLAHKLGAWVDRLEKAAFKAIEREYDRWIRLQTAKSDAVKAKKRAEYEKAKREAEEKIELYDRFHYLYLCLISTLQVFDKRGNLNEREAAETTVRAALDLMEELNDKSINEEVRTIRKLIADLFSYLDEAKRIAEELKELGLAEEIVKTFCIAWQYQKNRIKAKKPERRNKYKDKEQEELELLKDELGEEFQELKETIYAQLDNIVQSSAMVENINSILRMHLNTTKNHVTQGMLNLFMFYHNHRRYVAGKRKGKIPIEILTGRKQEKDWLELLIEKVPWDQSEFLKAA
jgi:hypothetical protein